MHTISSLVCECINEAKDADFSIIDDLCQALIATNAAVNRGPLWHGIIRRIVVEAAREKLSNEEFQTVLQSSNAPFINELSSAYEKYGADISKAMESIGYRYPNLIETEWKLSGLMESNSEFKIKAPLVEMTFKSLPAGSDKTDKFSFVCTKDELLELQNVVREAENMLLKLSQK